MFKLYFLHDKRRSNMLRLVLYYFHNDFSILCDFNELGAFEQLSDLPLDALINFDEVAAVPLAPHNYLCWLFLHSAL